MIVGTTVQHSNISPTSNESIQAIGMNIPGRLNDFKKFAWFDFTHTGSDNMTLADPATLSFGQNKINTIKNKFYHLTSSVDAQSTAEGNKGPNWDHTPGQDDYYYAQCTRTSSEYLSYDHLRFKNPTSFITNNFTATVIFDSNLDSSNNDLDDDEVFFRIAGSSGAFLQIGFHKGSASSTLGDTFLLWYHDASNQNHYAWKKSDIVENHTGGDRNVNFNWITFSIVNGTPSMYLRGVPISLTIADTFPYGLLLEGMTSHLFINDSDPNLSSDPSIYDTLGSKVYEIMIFNEGLSVNSLKNIDMYVKEKYKSYQYGWVNGYEREEY